MNVLRKIWINYNLIIYYMKVVILAGGKGTRISEYTKTIPKPMIRSGSKPILEHIIKYYIKYGFKDFIIAGGYKY